jgi:FkbM family methyltransferase
MFRLQEILGAKPPPVRVVDVGAAEYGKDPYASLTEQGLCEVVGFEPNAANCERRNAAAPKTHRYLPHALGDGRKRRFYECENPLTSSLYRPNDTMLHEFSRLALPLVAEYDIQTLKLDDVSEVTDMDYLKLDVQGAELDVILGAPRLLQGALVVHTEVEFIPMYEGQPLFGDVDVALRKAGFWLHRMDGITRARAQTLQAHRVAVRAGESGPLGRRGGLRAKLHDLRRIAAHEAAQAGGHPPRGLRVLGPRGARPAPPRCADRPVPAREVPPADQGLLAAPAGTAIAA